MREGWISRSCDGDVFAKVNVLDRVEELDPFLKGSLERFASGDEAHSARAFVNDCSGDGFLHIVIAAGSTAVNEPGATHVAVCKLVPGEIDWVIGGELGVDSFVELAVAGVSGIECFKSAVEFGQLLLDDIRFDRDAKVVRLTRQVGGCVIVFASNLESIVAEIAPEHGRHAELVRVLERLADFDDLARGFFAAKVDGRPDRRGAHIPGLLHVGKHHLVEFVGVGEELVMIDFDQERNFVRIFAAHHPEHAQGGSDRVASAFDSKVHDSFGIKASWVLSERRSPGVLDPLIYGQDRKISGAPESTVVEHSLQVHHNLGGSVAQRENSVHKVWAGQVELSGIDGLASVLEQ